jgi:transposase InsO family protein
MLAYTTEHPVDIALVAGDKEAAGPENPGDRDNGENTAGRVIVSQSLLLHHRLGHAGQNAMQIVKRQHGLDIALEGHQGCKGCNMAKASRRPHLGPARHRATIPLVRIHADVSGPHDPATMSGYKYTVCFVDDATRYSWTYFMKTKDEVPACLEDFVERVEKRFIHEGYKVIVLRDDKGGEFTGKKVTSYLTRKGITHETTTTDTPPQNGVAERFWRMVWEAVRAFMHSMCIPQSLWAELMRTAVYVRNVLPTSANAKHISPHQALFGELPDIGFLRVIWSKGFAYILPKNRRGKMARRAVEVRMLGYSWEKKAYRVFDPASNQVLETGDVTFDEASALTTTPPIVALDDVYEIEAIRDQKGDEYLVKWVGFDDPTWEPYHVVEEASALRVWNARHQNTALLAELDALFDASAPIDPDFYISKKSA